MSNKQLSYIVLSMLNSATNKNDADKIKILDDYVKLLKKQYIIYFI